MSSWWDRVAIADLFVSTSLRSLASAAPHHPLRLKTPPRTWPKSHFGPEADPATAGTSECVCPGPCINGVIPNIQHLHRMCSLVLHRYNTLTSLGAGGVLRERPPRSTWCAHDISRSTIRFLSALMHDAGGVRLVRRRSAT